MTANTTDLELETLRVNRLFEIPVCVLALKDASRLNGELIEEIRKLRARDKGVRISNRGGYHSKKDLFDHNLPGFRKLMDGILRSYNETRMEVYGLGCSSTDQLRVQGWVNVNSSGDSNEAHEHLGGGCHWSGVYYVQTPKCCQDPGHITFENLVYKDFGTGTKRIWRVPSPSQGRGQSAYHNCVPLRPSEGEIVLFPSSTIHRVDEFRGEGERISIAFNITDPALNHLPDAGDPLPFSGLRSWVRYYFYGVYLPLMRMKQMLVGHG